MLGWTRLYVGLDPFVCWTGPVCMLGWAYCMICGIFRNSLSFVLTIFWFKHFHILSVPKGKIQLDSTASPIIFRTDDCCFTVMSVIYFTMIGFGKASIDVWI